MNEMLLQSAVFGVAVSVFCYEAGAFLRKKLGVALLNPLLFAVIAVILILRALQIDYTTYYQGARYLSVLLTPATVCFAVPLYEQTALLKRHHPAILAGIASGVLSGLAGILALSALFGLSHTEYVTLLPKSITTAIGMGVCEELGGMTTVSVVVIIVTGILGNLIAQPVCRLFRIEEPIARGIGIGCASHAIGTAKAMEMGEIEGAMSGLAIAVAGLLTVAAAPVFALLY